MSSVQADLLPSSCRISELWAYPLKSAAGQALDTMQLDQLGPCGDRRWMLVDAEGHFITQRQLPLMSQLGAEVIATEEAGAAWAVEEGEKSEKSNRSWPGSGLRLSLGEASLDIPLPTAQTESFKRVEVWGDHVDALDGGDTAAAWLSERLGRTLRLVFIPDAGARQVDIAYGREGEQVSFADGFPLLLINQATVDALSAALSWTYPAHRLRPNLVVSDLPALAENKLKSLSWGEWRLDVLKPCSRCVIPSIEPDSSVKQREVMEALKAYRGDDGKVYFGQNLILRRVDGSALSSAAAFPCLRCGDTLQLSY